MKELEFKIQGFEDALSSLLKDVRTIETEQQQMEDQFNRYINNQLNFSWNQFQTVIWPITNTECHIRAKSPKYIFSNACISEYVPCPN